MMPLTQLTTRTSNRAARLNARRYPRRHHAPATGVQDMVTHTDDTTPTESLGALQARIDAVDLVSVDDIDWAGTYQAYWSDLYATYQHVYGAAGRDTEYTDPHEAPDEPDPCPTCGGTGWIEDHDGRPTDCDCYITGQPWDDNGPLF